MTATTMPGSATSMGPGPTPPPYIPGISREVVTPRRKRNHRSELAIWWREIDRVLLFLIALLMAVGTLAVAAASPASAIKLSDAKHHYEPMYFFTHHLVWQCFGVFLMFLVSLMPRDLARRSGVLLAAAMLLALMLVPVIGTDHNGAKRWLLGTSFQPSEFLKPSFSIFLAWILSLRLRDATLPVMAMSSAMTGLVVVLLMLQPDFGSAVLFVSVWFVLLLLSGLPVKRIAMVGVAGLFGVVAAYLFYGNARNRIDAFLGGGTAYDQVDIARHTLTAGGWTGTGLWLGTHKLSLPEAHTDYILSVIGEEFGLIACAIIVLLYLAVVARVLRRLADEDDLFTILAASGLVAQIGGQAFINILVNLQLFPSKGMTLPLISYGGSSTVALCLGVGFLLALTRRNPFLARDPFTRPLVVSGARAVSVSTQGASTRGAAPQRAASRPKRAAGPDAGVAS